MTIRRRLRFISGVAVERIESTRDSVAGGKLADEALFDQESPRSRHFTEAIGRQRESLAEQDAQYSNTGIVSILLERCDEFAAIECFSIYDARPAIRRTSAAHLGARLRLDPSHPSSEYGPPLLADS
jgi:hypothetical protein